MRTLVQTHRQGLLLTAMAIALLLAALLIVASQMVDPSGFSGDINGPPTQRHDGSW
jgi:hypothetical protein